MKHPLDDSVLDGYVAHWMLVSKYCDKLEIDKVPLYVNVVKSLKFVTCLDQ